MTNTTTSLSALAIQFGYLEDGRGVQMDLKHLFRQGFSLVGLTVNYVMYRSPSRTETGAGEVEVKGGVEGAGAGSIV